MQEALRSLQARLALYKTLPPHGLACFSGAYEDAEGRPQRVCVVVEPPSPLRQSFYRCSAAFHLDQLRDQLAHHDAVGFILIDGQNASFWSLAGPSRTLLFEWRDVPIPKKHGRGGQSQNRFARQRVERRDWYVTRVGELALAHFLPPPAGRPSVVALVLAGAGDLKADLARRLDPRLAGLVVCVVDVQYAGGAGLAEALDKAEPQLRDLSYYAERRTLAAFLEALRTGAPVSWGPLEVARVVGEGGGVVERLLVWADLALSRRLWGRGRGAATRLQILHPDGSPLTPPPPGPDWVVVEEGPLLTWLVARAGEVGAGVTLISGETPAGAQFVAGFGGIGAFLRYPAPPPEDEDEKKEGGTGEGEGEGEGTEDEYEW